MPETTPISDPKEDRPPNPHWDSLVERLCAETRPPETVLVAGCRLGPLVEMLRERGVDAVGIEDDPERLAEAGSSIRPYFSLHEYSQPLAQDYDLIVFPAHWSGAGDLEEGAIIENISHHTRTMVFAFSETDSWRGPPAFERTGVKEALSGRGFHRDSDFDTDQAPGSSVRFRRVVDPDFHSILAQYERVAAELTRENARLREQVEKARALANNATADRLDVLQKENERLRAQTDADVENHPLVQTLTFRLKQWESIWADMERSMGWRILHRLRRFRLSIAPPGSRRAFLLRLGVESLGRLQEEGFRASISHLWAGLRSPWMQSRVVERSVNQINADAYPVFIRTTAISPELWARQLADMTTWSWRPLISFITPVYQPPPDVLRELLDSVRKQNYENWEMCIADASLASPEIRDLLAEYADNDSRIKIQYLDTNLGICGNSNAALEMATGEFVAILDHDDRLAPEMLYEVVRRLRENPEADVLYFDEDKLSEDGRVRRDPFFKPDFSPEMLLSANYLTHAVFRRSLVVDVGGFDPEFEGCQDWDLAFKVTERTDQVEHIPRVLYHWRQVRGSTAGDFGAKSYVFERQLKCVRNHLERVGLEDVQTSFPSPGFLRAEWPVQGKKVSIIIPTKDKVSYLKRTLDSLFDITRYPDYEVVIVDNGSRKRETLEYFEQLRADERVSLVNYNEIFNYSRANNLGSSHADGDIFLFLNNDVEILHADWLEELVRWADRPEIGIVGAKLLYPDNSIQHAGVVVGLEGHASHVFWGYYEKQGGPFGSVDWYRNFSAVTGACMMVRRDVFEEIGGFSEKYVLAFSDIEICLRAIQHGYRVVYTPFAKLFHYEGKSRGDHIPSNDVRIGVDDFMPVIQRGDPYFNPNLSYIERKPMIRPHDEEDRVSRLLRIAAAARADELTASSVDPDFIRNTKD